MPTMVKRSRAQANVLVQAHVSKQAAKLIEERAVQGAISKSAVVRQLLYRALGLMPEDKPHG